jgi:mediator of RNA polymerase II transcription subunit 12, fungi type
MHFFLRKKGEAHYKEWESLVAMADAERSRGEQTPLPQLPPRASTKQHQQQQCEPPAMPPPSADTDLTLEQRSQVAENLLAAIEAIVRGSTMSRPPQMIPSMVERLQDLWELLANPEAADAHPSVLNHWLPLLLTFITLNIQSFDATIGPPGSNKPGPEARARVLVISSGLIQQLDSLGGPDIDRNACVVLSQRILDLASVLADGLPDENRLACIRTGKDYMYDVRIRYLFSYQLPPDENFMLSHREKQPAAGNPGGPPAPGTRGGAPVPGAGLLGTPMHIWGLEPRPQQAEKLVPFQIRRWELLSEPTPIVGENDTALSLTLFEARKKRGA